MRRVVPVLLGMVLLAPAVGAAAGPTLVDGSAECDQETSVVAPCFLYARASLTIPSCGDATCVFEVASSANTVARLANLLYVSSHVLVTDGSGGGACLGPKSVRDEHPELLGSCAQLCETFTVGHSASCEGAARFDVTIPAGECVSVLVPEHMTWGYWAESAHLVLRFDACRLAGNAFDVDAYVWSASGAEA